MAMRVLYLICEQYSSFKIELKTSKLKERNTIYPASYTSYR